MTLKEPAGASASTTGAVQQPERKLAGILVRKFGWRLSWRGWVLAVFVVCGSLAFAQRYVYHFLAVTDPRPPSSCLVMEGWMQADQLREAYRVFQQGGYQMILTSGCRVEDQWDPKLVVTYADWAAAKLRRLGVPPELIHPVPSYVKKKDRTYSSALAVKQWLATNNIKLKDLNIVTMGAHARRSRLLFQKALGPDIQVGVIAIEDEQFDPKHWWRTSEGVREILGETIAYVYARFFFYP